MCMLHTIPSHWPHLVGSFKRGIKGQRQKDRDIPSCSTCSFVGLEVNCRVAERATRQGPTSDLQFPRAVPGWQLARRQDLIQTQGSRFCQPRELQSGFFPSWDSRWGHSQLTSWFQPSKKLSWTKTCQIPNPWNP